MRKGNKPEVLLTEDGKLQAIDLSADYCAEHEWGIKDIKRDFGINDTLTARNIGIKRFAVKKSNANLVHFRKGAECILLYSDMNEWEPDMDFDKAKGRLRDINERDEIYAGWSTEDFGIYMKNDSEDMLMELYTALQNKEAAIWLGGHGAFKNSGFIIGIVKNISDDNLKIMKDADEDQLKLNKAVKKSGILKRLEAKQNTKEGYHRPCGYHCCKAAWISENRAKDSYWNIMFWLNPQNQADNNFCWCTVEELDLWIAGTGPIPKNK